MKVGIVIQAHMGSTRLPGKALKLLVGKPMLWHIVERCKQAHSASVVIVATSIESADDAIEAMCKEYGFACFRGSDVDVTARYWGAAEEFNLDAIVRVTSDCPLIDPGVIDGVISRFQEGYDYAANYLNYDYLTPRPQQLPAFPHGLEVEMCSREALKRAYEESHDPWQREHVTYVWQNTSKVFKLAPTIVASSEYQRPYRLTVDYPEDFVLMERIYDTLYREGSIIDTREAFQYLDKHQEIAELNKKYQH